MQGGSLTNQTQVDQNDTGSTSYVFRNSGSGPVSNNLIRFFALSSTDHIQPMLLDDIYLAPGRNLSDPTTAPPLLAVTKLQSGKISLSWPGSATLQWSAQVATGYTDLTGATSPFQVDTTTASPRFYRLKQ